MNLPRIRDDLEFYPPETGDAGWLVKDPLAGQFYRFGKVHIEIIKSLDGKRTIDKVAEDLAQQFGARVDVNQISSFCTRLERLRLLDIGCYRDVAPEVARMLARTVRRQKLVPKEMIEETVRDLERGDVAAAVQTLRRLEGAQATSLLALIHASFFRTGKNVPKYMIRLFGWNPDRFLTYIDRAIGRHVFGWAGACILLASCVVSGVLLTRGPFPSLEGLTAFDVVGGLLLYSSVLVVHEIGHGLACTHYGGRAQDMGFMLMYWAFPGAYCDVSDTYRFTARRHRIMTLLSGTLVQIWILSFLFLIDRIMPESSPLHGSILLCLLFGCLSLGLNLIPFMPFDGYFALAEFVGIVNLRERSLRHVGQELQKTVLRVPVSPSPPRRRFTDQKSEDPASLERERKILFRFGLGTIVFFAIFRFGIVLPCAIYFLGRLGILISVVFIGTFIVVHAVPFLKNAVRLLRTKETVTNEVDVRDRTETRRG